ncbi:hypothetical protein MOU92_000011 [Vibrio parahaemolyticus]|nr:hypothetical protein [Vibrio parahaemolyticus]EIZ1313341.1 hypothetical protein [Vibrio parahaemolyticus]EJG0894317.1 hypothetical protein [Vibrio parahaemolyticus]EKA7389635.1 hypothetical protein [Vibrio parahaemolyticus]ELA9321337.1 hypothetical protein [Vibrio parahaemolyticus]
MSNYHVLIKEKDSDSWICLFKDLSEPELFAKFVLPYKKGVRLLVSGSVIETRSLKSIRVISTRFSHKAELQKLQERSRKEIDDFNTGSPIVLISPGDGYQDSEIKDCGDDVTDQFLTSAAGEVQETSSVKKLVGSSMFSQTVVAVIGTVVGGLILALLTL